MGGSFKSLMPICTGGGSWFLRSKDIIGHHDRRATVSDAHVFSNVWRQVKWTLPIRQQAFCDSRDRGGLKSAAGQKTFRRTWPRYPPHSRLVIITGIQSICLRLLRSGLMRCCPPLFSPIPFWGSAKQQCSCLLLPHSIRELLFHGGSLLWRLLFSILYFSPLEVEARSVPLPFIRLSSSSRCAHPPPPRLTGCTFPFNCC